MNTRGQFHRMNDELEREYQAEKAEDDEYLSECCGAYSTTETCDGLGMCADCGEHAQFVNGKGEIEE